MTQFYPYPGTPPGREIPTFGTCGQPRHDDGSCFDNRVNVAAARGRSFDWSCIPQMENGREERAQKPARAALRQPLWSNRWRPHGDSNPGVHRSEEHTSELQSLMRNSYAVFCL